MTIFVRADASTQTGTGHVMRCLALAIELRRASQRVEFISLETVGTLRPLIERNGFRVHRLRSRGVEGASTSDLARGPTHAGARRLDARATSNVLRNAEERPTWLIVDHYALDAEWEAPQRKFVDKILVVDDLADRPHDCDVLLDQNYPLAGDRYDALVPDARCVLQGPTYALLREEFRLTRANLRPRVGEIGHLLISFGGADSTNETAKALRALACLGAGDLTADVIVGGTNPHIEDLKERALSMPQITLHVQATNVAELTARADLAICAGGSSVWERCCLGLPSAMIATAEHQVPFARALAENGYALYLGDRASVDHEDIAQVMASVRNDPPLLAGLSRRGMALVDGRGCERVVAHVLGTAAAGVGP